MIGALTGLAVPETARAGTIAVVSCKTPAGAPAPTEGWEEGWTGGPLPDAGDSNECPSGGALSSFVGDREPQPGSSGPYWQYTPPAGDLIVGGEVSAFFTVPGAVSGYGGASGLLAPKFLFDGADWLGGTNAGSVEAAYSLVGHTGGNVWIYAFCEPPGASCPAGGSYAWYWSVADMKSATIELNNSDTPQAGSVSGTLLAGTASGTAHLDLTASESGPGPGIYAVTVFVDGQVLYNGTPDGNGGRCTSVGHDSSGVIEFLYATPCPLSEQVDLPIDTTKLSDGHHELRVTVTDAAGVAEAVYDGTISTANRTTVSGLLSSPLAASLGGEPTYAIVLDRRSAVLGASLTRSFGASALTLSGELRNPAGVAAPGVPVFLLARAGNHPANSFTVLARTITDGAGRWALHAPKGPSRQLRIVDGNPAQDAPAGAGVGLTETVSPTLGLRVRTPGGARLVFSGRLAISPLGTPRPLVIIETRTSREWEAVGHSIRVRANGSYSYLYASSPLTLRRRFAFRAVTPATSLWQTGSSPVREAVVR